MKRIYFICSLMLMVVLISSTTVFAKDNPFPGLTQEQVIQKYFEGRQLDKIEGIWLDQRLKPQFIIKSSLIDPNKKYGNSDYLMVEYSSKHSVDVATIQKTQYPSHFYTENDSDNFLRFVSPTTLQKASGYQFEGAYAYFYYVRVYPNDEK